jgi:hypothetical protein
MLDLLHPDVESGKVHNPGHVGFHKFHTPRLLNK